MKMILTLRLGMNSMKNGHGLCTRIRPWAAALITLAVTGCTHLQPEPPLLVRGGEAHAEIIIAEAPARMTRLAAEELQDALEKISGARLDILTEPTGERMPIYVGESRFTRDLGLDVSDLTDGAYRIAGGADWLALLGPDGDFDPDRLEPWGRARTTSERDRINQEMAELAGEPFRNPFHSLYMHYFEDLDVWVFDEEGTLNAVYAFLHDLGMRWYFPGELGEVVPTLADIPLPHGDRTVRPDFPVRDWYMYFMHTGFSEDLQRWHLRLGYNRGERWIGHLQRCHVMKYVNELDAFREKHPETTAVREGETPRAPAMCLSSERTFELHVKFVRFLFDHFDQRMVNIDMPDGFGSRVCQCTDCRAQFTPQHGRGGGTSDYVWGYIDRVAREVYRSHPDRMVSGLAYSSYLQPPEKIERMSPNLAIIHAMWRSNNHDPETEAFQRGIREAWMPRLPSGEWYTYDYFLHSRQQRRGRPTFFPWRIAKELRALKGISPGDTIEIFNALDWEAEAYHPFAITHLNLYVTSRLWWDADLDLDALLDEYAALYYGPARDAIRALIEHGEETWPNMQNDPEPIARALELIESAQAAVEPGSVYARRVDVLATYMEPLYALRDQLSRSREDVPRSRMLRTHTLGRRILDGRLDDETYWPPVQTRRLVNVESGDHVPGEHRTWFRHFHTDDEIYFGIHCPEPDMAGLDLDPTHGDYVEILLETSTHSYYRLRINPTGLVEDADHGDGVENTDWDSEAEVAVHRGENYWSVEVRIPIAGPDHREVNPWSGVDGRRPSTVFPWYFNVGRQRVRDGRVERTAYSPTGTQDFQVPERFAELWAR